MATLRFERTTRKVSHAKVSHVRNTFVGRAAELAQLDSELDMVRRTGGGRFVWVRGRRRVGKSRLVEEFCAASGVPYCFYQAPRRPREEAVAEFAAAAAESDLPTAAAFEDTTHRTWTAALRAAVQGSDRQAPTILVIDELPYLAEHDAGFTADLQQAWDRSLERLPVLLICIGSDVRMMGALVEARSPLHGRPTKEMHVQPLDPVAVATITGAADPAAAFDRYLVVGGLPSLAASWPVGTTMKTFLKVALEDDQTRFVTDALRILASEFQATVQARNVFEAIGHGETAHGRIAARSQISAKTLDAALQVLVAVKGMVRRDLPYAVPPGTKATKYTVADPYLRFWLCFIGPHLAELSRGRSDLVIARVLRDWTTYRGRAVEPLVRESLERLLADPATSDRAGGARHVGSWWRRDHRIEVDLVGADRPTPTRVGFIGSIKWHERARFQRAELDALAANRADVPGAGGAKLLVVSRTGIAASVKPDLALGPADLLDAWR